MGRRKAVISSRFSSQAPTRTVSLYWLCVGREESPWNENTASPFPPKSLKAACNFVPFSCLLMIKVNFISSSCMFRNKHGRVKHVMLSYVPLTGIVSVEQVFFLEHIFSFPRIILTVLHTHLLPFLRRTQLSASQEGPQHGISLIKCL